MVSHGAGTMPKRRKTVAANLALSRCTSEMTKRRNKLFVLLLILGVVRSQLLAESDCTSVTLQSAEHSMLPAELCVASAGLPPFPAVVDLRARSCEGPQGIPPGWEQTALPSWGYTVLAIDSLAARGLAKKCADWDALTPRHVIGDAYAGLAFLSTDRQIDSKRIALLGFRTGIATAALFADSAEALSAFSSKNSPRFRAVFAISPYCNLSFSGAEPRFYAPARVFTGEKDDFEPAERCVELGKSLQAAGANIDVTVYPDAGAGFDLTPTDTNYPLRDVTAMHPGGTTVSTHPQYSPWANNLAKCTIMLNSVFDRVDPAALSACAGRGIHFQGTADTAATLQSDLKRELSLLMGR
jgi:dienelactone hydrolase